MEFREAHSEQISWLLNSDPSIQYQTHRDLLNTQGPQLEEIRSNIITEGWGKALMDLQDPEGTWSKSLYSPKWTSTFYTLLLLKRFAAPSSEHLVKACMILLNNGFYEKDGGINYWKTWKQGECCVSAMLLSMLCHFKIEDKRSERILEFIINDQMDDKGWNCNRSLGARHSSFHSTISVLEGLREYEKQYPQSKYKSTILSKQKEGEEFLLSHHLYKSDTTWKPVDIRMTQAAFPPRWHYDIFRGLDYFQEKSAPKDSRMNDAMELLSSKRTKEGFWKQGKSYSGKQFFALEKGAKPGRWNTLRALRILKWWETE